MAYFASLTYFAVHELLNNFVFWIIFRSICCQIDFETQLTKALSCTNKLLTSLFQ